MNSKQDLGQKGEALAEEYLKIRGYETLQRNYRYRHAEIDLITKKDDLLVFVEVKTRTSTIFGMPETFVEDHQAEKITEAAVEFMEETGWEGQIRFDIIAIIWNGQKPEIEHIEDAFY